MRKGFALIELMIVLVAVFILVSLLGSSLTWMAKTQSKTLCKANLKAFSGALQQYSQDNNGYLPFPGLKWTTKAGGLGKYTDSYLSNKEPSKNPERFVCPADMRKESELSAGGSKFWMKTPKGKWGYFKVSYGINLVVTGMPDHQYFLPHRLDMMGNPAACFMFSDSLTRDNPGATDRFALRHNKKANIAFADGHVEEVEKKAIPAWKSHLEQPFWHGTD